MAEHRYRIDRWPTAISISAATAASSVANRVQSFLLKKKCDNFPLEKPPVFILGHWRSGTTLVHNLMTLDKRFGYPTTYHTFIPRAFLISEWWFKPLTWPLLPRRRPMDNMPMNWDVPAEDEFALTVMGFPSVYRRIAFPNDVPRHLDYLNMDGIPGPELERWKDGLREFFSYLNYRYRGNQLLLKSPTHTGRVRTLLEMYPNALFLHITRNPIKFIPSTIHMWAALDHSNSMQTPHNRNLRSFVFDCFKRLYDGFDRDRHLLNDRNFVEIRFEDLVKDFTGVLGNAYQRLGIDGFDEHARPALETEMKRTKNYKGNQHSLAPDLQDEILEKCVDYMERFGYSPKLATA